MTDLFSAALVARYVHDDRHFVERRWFADRLDEALADAGCRFLLLTGAPGAGKTAGMAWLANRQPLSLRYFVRRDSRVPFATGDARSLLLALGHQLASSRPELFRPDRLEIVVRQRVERLEKSGQLVGIELEDLLVSPFYQTSLRVDQELTASAGETVGVRIRHAVLEERLLAPENLQYLALLDPAAVLLTRQPQARIVVLIDGLDELRYRTGGETVLDWLTNLPELPPNVRLVLSSRPDDGLLALFRERQREWLRESAIESDATAVEADAGDFARRYAREPGVQRALANRGMSVEELVSRSLVKAAGNFQYLSALYRAIGDTDDVDLDRLPTDLTDLYRFFLELVIASVRGESVELPSTDLVAVPALLPAWEGLYEPVLGLLTAAYAPLTVAQLERFLGRGSLGSPLTRLRQFLRQRDGLVDLYHETFREYLATRVDVAGAHRRIARFYRAGRRLWSDVDWPGVDEYGLTYLAQHLERHPAELDGLLCRPLMDEKLRRYGSHASFAADVRLADDVAARNTDPTALVGELRARWLGATLAAAAQAVPLDFVAAVARTGAAVQALGLAELVPDGTGRANAYLAAGAELIRAGDNDSGRLALNSALTLLEQLPTVEVPQLARIAVGFGRARDAVGIGRTAALVERLSEPADVATVTAVLVHAYATTGSAEACVEWAGRLPLVDSGAIASTCRALVLVGRDAAAVELAERAPAPDARAECLAAAAEEMVRQGRRTEGAALASRALEISGTAAARDAIEALNRSGAAALTDVVSGLPTRRARIDGWFALLASTADNATAAHYGQAALDAVLDEVSPQGLLVRSAPLLAAIGARALLWRAFQAANGLPDDGYGATTEVIARFAEAFASIGDTAGVDATLDAALTVADNTGAQYALVGVARACVDTDHRVAEVRAAGRRLHRHFVEPWAIDVEVAFSLAEAGRVVAARDLLAALIAEVQRPSDVYPAIAWRVGVADALNSEALNADSLSLEAMNSEVSGAEALSAGAHRAEAALLCQEAIAKGETLATSGDKNDAHNRQRYFVELSGQDLTDAVAEGMEWALVVDANGPILPHLARTGHVELLDAAITRLVDIAAIGWPPAEAFAVLAGPAAAALTIAGRVDEAGRFIDALMQRSPRSAGAMIADLVPTLVQAGEIEMAVLNARNVVALADWLQQTEQDTDGETFGRAAVALDAAGLTEDADAVLAGITDDGVRSEALESMARRALDHGERDRATRLVNDLVAAVPDKRPVRRARLLAQAALALARLGDRSRSTALIADVLAILAGDGFHDANALPGILSALAEAAEHNIDSPTVDRLLDHAATIRDGGWRRRAVRKVAEAATISTDLASRAADVRSEILAVAATRSGSVDDWRRALHLDRDMNLDALAHRIASDADLLARIDNGATLYAITRSLSTLDTWWSPNP